MIIKGLIDEDFVQYKKPSMTIMFPTCSFKCEIECGAQVCQNSTLATSQDISVDIENVVTRYINNPITQSVVCGGLEPFDSWDDLWQLVIYLRIHTEDDIVIYTGYYKTEIEDKVKMLIPYKNIIIKFGRFWPGHEKRYDEVLGVYLASENQFGEKIS